MDPRSKLLLAVASIALGAVFAGFLLTPQKETSHLDPEIEAQNRAAAQGLAMREKKDHPVTPEQQAIADRQSATEAPQFDLPGLDGKNHSLGSLIGAKPLLIFFIEKNCPCCLGAKSYFEQMHKLYKDVANSVGIINAEATEADKWRTATKAEFLILMDPSLGVIKKFKADRGAYVTLVGKDGKILKQYAGYDEAMLQELSEKIASLTGVKPRKYNSVGAPDHLTSGCLFPEPGK